MATAQEIEYFITTVGSSANQIAKKFIESHSKAILPSIVIAQAALESGWGTSNVAKNAKNLFGMKFGSGAKNDYYDGSKYGDYRKFSSWHASVGDYYHLITSRGSSRYAKATNQSDVVYVMNALVEGGYCDDAGYAQQVVDIYNSRKEQLQQYDSGIAFAGNSTSLAPSEPLKDYRSLILTEARRILQLNPKPQYSQDYRNQTGYYDCSSFCSRVFKAVLGEEWMSQNGLADNEGNAPTTDTWIRAAEKKGILSSDTDVTKLKAGSIRFFCDPGESSNHLYVYHVGIAVGDGTYRMIHARNSDYDLLEEEYKSVGHYKYNADFLEGVTGIYGGIGSEFTTTNYAEADFTGHILAGGLPLTNIDTYGQTMLDNLSLIRSANHDAGYLIDLTTGGEFKFYIPEYSKNLTINYDDVSILGRSVNLKGYSGGSGVSINLSLDLVAGSGYYTKKSHDDDPIDRMYSDIAFIESLSYPDYSKSMVFPPSVVLLSLGSAVTLKGVVTNFTADYKKPFDTYNRSMYVTVNFTVQQVTDNPPDLFDVRSRNEVTY